MHQIKNQAANEKMYAIDLSHTNCTGDCLELETRGSTMPDRFRPGSRNLLLSKRWKR